MLVVLSPCFVHMKQELSSSQAPPWLINLQSVLFASFWVFFFSQWVHLPISGGTKSRLEGPIKNLSAFLSCFITKQCWMIIKYDSIWLHTTTTSPFISDTCWIWARFLCFLVHSGCIRTISVKFVIRNRLLM